MRISVLALICAIFFSAPSLCACLRLEACLDGSDFISIQNYLLKITHKEAAPLGNGATCKNIQNSTRNLSLYLAQGGTVFLQNAGLVNLDAKGNLALPVEIKQLNRFEVIEGRGTTVMDPYNANQLFMTDISPSGRFNYGGAGYVAIDLCD